LPTLRADSDALWLQHATNLVAFIADTVIEPYYVAPASASTSTGAASSKGWDLEVEFRRMTQRHAGSAAARRAAALAASWWASRLMPASSALPPSRARARIASTPLPRGDVKRELKAVRRRSRLRRKGDRLALGPRGTRNASTPHGCARCAIS
jgi:hypothetical protein